MKNCVKCNISKTLKDFSFSKKHKDNLLKKCKLCEKEDSKQYYLKNKDKIKLRCSNYKLNNREIIKEKNKNYLFKNREIINQNKKERYVKNKERYRQYGLENRKSLSKYQVTRIKNKLKTDPIFKLQFNLRCRIRAAIKLDNAKKCKKSIELLGCSIQFIKKYLEDRFLPTMSWENYGSYWHIDHIIPCSKFDLSYDEEQKKCFHYSNLQPLFAVTQVIDGIEYIGNLNKNNKIL